MKVTKEEVLALAKQNGFSKADGEALLVLLSKKTGGFLIDLIGLAARKSENKYDDMVVAAGEPQLRKMLDELKIVL